MIRRLALQSLGQITRRSVAPVALRLKTVRPISNQLNNSFIRYQSTAGNGSKTAQIKVDNPEMMIAFTCKKCDTRSSHVMSKQAYTSGTVLITCPGCKNRHLIADHLKVSVHEISNNLARVLT